MDLLFRPSQNSMWAEISLKNIKQHKKNEQMNLTPRLLLQIKEHLIKGAGSWSHLMNVGRFRLLSAVQKATTLRYFVVVCAQTTSSNCWQQKRFVLHLQKRCSVAATAFCKSSHTLNKANLCLHHWIVSEFTVRFHSIVALGRRRPVSGSAATH